MKRDDHNLHDTFDHSTHQEFVEYYAEASLTESSISRMKGIVNCVNRNMLDRGITQKLNVADIGCGPGAMSLMWAQQGHSVYGLDVNEALLDVAKQRADKAGVSIEFCLGSATKLPWETESMDVCIAPELLEHVVDWKSCLTEFVRILKPNGVLYVSTANKLCPIQQEFNLPLYSWYPGFLKRYFENLARTTRPDLAGYAKYPAVNWFSYYQLRQELLSMGMQAFDRFDIMDLENKPQYQVMIVGLIRCNPVMRWLAHMASPGLTMLAIKNT